LGQGLGSIRAPSGLSSSPPSGKLRPGTGISGSMLHCRPGGSSARFWPAQRRTR
jgi:hypothetical protein